MLLKDMINNWIKFNENELIVIDGIYALSYYYDNIPLEVMNRKIKSFYFIYNKLYLRI